MLKKLFNRFKFKIVQKLIKKDFKLSNSLLLKNSWKFCINECIIGDYYEFGVFKGETFLSSIITMGRVFNGRSKVSTSIGTNQNSDLLRKSIVENCSFHAFDSFQGLPELAKIDLYSDDFCKGQFNCSVDFIKKKIKQLNISPTNIFFHQGWFRDTCTIEYFKSNNLRKAAIIWIDCDLYSSAISCFEILHLIIQDGTVLIIDDWFCNKGNPKAGLQLAFNEWCNRPDIANNYVISQYQKEGWKRNSFIINSKSIV